MAAVTAVLEEACLRLAAEADKAKDRSLLSEDAVRAHLGNSRAHWGARGTKVGRETLAAFGVEDPERFKFCGFGLPDEHLDDLAMFWSWDGRRETTWVNHKLAEADSGVNRVGAGTTFFGAATGRRVAHRGPEIAEAVLATLADPYRPLLLTSLVAAFVAPRSLSPSRPTKVVCYDTTTSLAYAQGPATPEAGTGAEEWADADGPATVGFHLPEAWLVQMSHKRSAAVCAEVLPALAAAGVGSSAGLDIASDRFAVLADRAADEEKRRTEELVKVKLATAGDRAEARDRALAAVGL